MGKEECTVVMISRENGKKVFFNRVIDIFSWKNIIWMFIFSLIISCCLFTYVNSAVDSLFQKSDIKITLTEKDTKSLGNEIWIIKINGKEITQELYDSLSKSDGWQFRTAKEWGYGDNVIISDKPGSTISIPISKSPLGGFSIWCQSYSGKIEVETNDGTKNTYDLYSENSEDHLQITPYADNYTSVFLRILFFLALAFIIFVLLVLILLFVRKYLIREEKTPKYKYWQLVAALTIAITTFSCVWYKCIGIPNFPGFGDGLGYWSWGYTLARPGVTKQEIVGLLYSLPTFRGYGIFIPHFLSNFIGLRIGVSAFAVYFAILAVIVAIAFGYAIPRMFELVRGKKLHIWQILFGFFGFFYFFTNAICGLGSDMCGCAYYFLGIVFLLLMLKTGKVRFAFLSGGFFSLCLAARTSYLIGVGIIGLALLIYIVIVFVKKNKNVVVENGINSCKRLVALLAAFLFMFVLVCVPQIYINSLKGHFGLFAYDSDGAYFTETTTLLEQSADASLRGYITGYPELLYDAPTAHIKAGAGYEMDKEITMAQSMDSYAKQPLDGVISFAKKLFALIDVKSRIDLPTKDWQTNTKYYIFSTVNYTFLITALFLVVNRRVRNAFFNKKDLLLWGVILAGPILPTLAGKIEWRAGMVLYIFYIVWAFAYCLTDAIYDKEKRDLILKENYFRFLSIGVLACHGLTLWMHIR